jgi:uncharacterized protein
MQALIENTSADLAALCRRLHVRRLDVFGSAAREDFDPASSDLDFIVEFEPIAPVEYADAYFSLKAGLETLFGRSVDLVTAASIANPYFRASVAASRQRVYAA